MEQRDALLTVQQATAKKGLSFRGLVKVFYMPSAFFAELKDHPKILIPYMVIAVLLFCFFAITADIIYNMQVSSPQFQELMRRAGMTPQMERSMRYQILIGGPIVRLLAPLIAAVLGMFWGNFVFAGKTRFKQLLSVMLYGEIIYRLGMIAVLPLVLAKKSMLVSLSLGVLAASQGQGSILYLALSKIDLFLIWEIIAIGIGLSITYGVPRNKGYRLSVLSMGMLSILHVVFSAVGKLIF
ncbi:MAG TPA: YIP1 family protein [Candidatus Deferrimicrobium sp.]|nr:YIP1 family protein [Candidatus Deferrimicrobium sp.]